MNEIDSTTPLISQDWLPDASKSEHDFVESSFFSIPGRRLPSPATFDASQDEIIKYPEMQLLVKFGPTTSVDEALTMWAIRKQFGCRIPVPEVFGWRVFHDTVFIYMELMPGVTLKQRWNEQDFSKVEKSSVCEQLHEMTVLLRQFSHKSTCPFIGSITGGPLLDRVFYDLPKAGPFNNLANFYNWLEWLPQRFLTPTQRFTDPYLDLLPKDSSIRFTHADIHPTNIMVSTTKPSRVVALIDWGQSGWYPDYWEYFKMSYTTHWEDEWRKKWIGLIVDPRENERDLLAEYTMSIGAL